MTIMTLQKQDGDARLGSVSTARGVIRTPAFMPVGTQATVKAMTPEEVEGLGADIILANTYHLLLRPGHERIRTLGGLHKFMNWRKPILTDSGGYQVFSLSANRTISDEGVTFRSHIDGAKFFLGPKEALDVQRALGSTICMVLDECPPATAEIKIIEQAVSRTLAWARRARSIEMDPGQLVFGIVQGGTNVPLRQRCAADLVELNFDGYAIGGLSVGEAKELTYPTTKETAAVLPQNKPRYLMGVGTPQDIVEGVCSGIDMFDCVLPTRVARNGLLFTTAGRINIKNTRYTEDARPVDESCGCYACAHYSRAYLRHLHQAGEILGARLATTHNLHYYLTLMQRIRTAIETNTFESFYRTFVGGPESDGAAKEGVET